MTRFFANANYDFIALRRYAYGITAALLGPGLLLLLFLGFNYSVEFTGGTLVQIKTHKVVDAGVLRAGLDKAGIVGAEIQRFGSASEYAIRARLHGEGVDPNDTQAAGAAVRKALDATLGAGQYDVIGTDAVGPKVGSELRQKALLAILLSFLAVLAYMAYRFEWRFGLAAVIATAHDILATVVFIGVMRLEVSLTVVAAVLSMVGYSLNDTIIIFDRVRENLLKHKNESFEKILNRSVNETLPRSVLTHGLTLASLLALAIFGGEVLRPFSLVMFFGVFIGTFSSIYIASPVLMEIERRWPSASARGHFGTKPAAPAVAGKPGRKAQPVA